MKKLTHFKQGAASFYIVAVSTLILVIIAASFAAVIISEVTRTSNDDLAQSAYDSALAGVEDAKLALINYQKCKADPSANLASPLTCAELTNWIEQGAVPSSDDGQPLESCDLVAYSLDRTVERDPNDAEKKLGVRVQEGDTTDNDMSQYYTCVIITNQTADVLGTLNSENPEQSFRIQFAPVYGDDGRVLESADTVMQNISKVRLSWHVPSQNGDYRTFDFMNLGGSGVFEADAPTPAVLSLTMVQTAGSFTLDDFNTSSGDTTDRGTLYFIPTNQGSLSTTDKYVYVNGRTISAAEGFVKSNDKGSGTQNSTNSNLPFVVYCDTSAQDYVCSVDVEIPQPVRGSRNSDTFVFSVALPYGTPETDFSLQFFEGDQPRTLDGVQIQVDSTGRANDLFRRVDTRLMPADAAYPYPIYGIEALEPGANPAIDKNFYTTCEYQLDDPTC